MLRESQRAVLNETRGMTADNDKSSTYSQEG